MARCPNKAAIERDIHHRKCGFTIKVVAWQSQSHEVGEYWADLPPQFKTIYNPKEEDLDLYLHCDNHTVKAHSVTIREYFKLG